MIARILFIAGSFSSFLPVGAAEGVPPVQVRERLAPWGTVVERSSFYEKDGKKVEHGLQESFSRMAPSNRGAATRTGRKTG